MHYTLQKVQNPAGSQCTALRVQTQMRGAYVANHHEVVIAQVAAAVPFDHVCCGERPLVAQNQVSVTVCTTWAAHKVGQQQVADRGECCSSKDSVFPPGHCRTDRHTATAAGLQPADMIGDKLVTTDATDEQEQHRGCSLQSLEQYIRCKGPYQRSLVGEQPLCPQCPEGAAPTTGPAALPTTALPTTAPAATPLAGARLLATTSALVPLFTRHRCHGWRWLYRSSAKVSETTRAYRSPCTTVLDSRAACNIDGRQVHLATTAAAAAAIYIAAAPAAAVVAAAAEVAAATTIAAAAAASALRTRASAAAVAAGRQTVEGRSATATAGGGLPRCARCGLLPRHHRHHLPERRPAGSGPRLPHLLQGKCCTVQILSKLQGKRGF